MGNTCNIICDTVNIFGRDQLYNSTLQASYIFDKERNLSKQIDTK